MNEQTNTLLWKKRRSAFLKCLLAVAVAITEVTAWHSPKAIAAGVNISGQVRKDVNSNGDIYEADPGISGVTVTLYQDDGTGNPTGAAIATATTDSNGNYSFPGIVVGNYVLVETNPTNYVSSGDSQGANDDKIAVSVGSFDKTSNVFLDVDTTLLDYGDAPDSYGTLSASNGARHTRNGTLFLGSGVTGEANGQTSTAANSDANDDGVTFSPSLGVNYSKMIQVGIQNTVNIVSSSAGYINAWVDYNQNGTFDSGEQILTNQAVSAGTNSLTFSTPPPNTIPHGTTYARFRISPTSITSPSPIGQISGGEVEDYQVNIADPVPDSQSCTATGLLNGSFESPLISGSSPTPLNSFVSGTIKTYYKKDMPGWNTTATDTGIELWTNGAAAGGSNGSTATSSFQGNQHAEINANQTAALYQDIATVPGSTLTWQLAHRGRTGPDTMDIKAGPPNGTLLLRRVTSDFNGWVVYRGTYTVPAGQFITRFQFEAVSTANGNTTTGNFIDAVQFSTDTCITPIFSPTIDLDANNSSGAIGSNFRGVFVGNSTTKPAADTDVTITDDKTNITSATITLTTRPDSTSESLSIDTTAGNTIPSGTVTASTYNSSTGILTLSGTTTLANYAKIIATLKYSNTKATPTTSDRIISVQVKDSDNLLSNVALSVLSQKIAPTVDLDGNDSSGAAGYGYTNKFFAGSSPVSAADIDVVTTDDGANLSKATIILTNVPDGNAESLSIDTTGTGINATSYTYSSTNGTGTITLTGNTSLTNYQKALATLKYNNTATNPNLTPRIINVSVVDTNDNLTSNTAVSTIQMNSISVNGTVFNDSDGSKTQNGTEALISGGLQAVLVNSSNKVVANTTVANGTYSFSNVPANANYTVLITTNTATVNQAPPAIALLNNWVSTGENLNGTADGTADSQISISVGTSNVNNVNFGIEQLPDTNNASAASQPNPGGTVQKTVPNLTGSDPEDGFLGSGKRFKIVTLPSNGTLYYNGTAITTAGQIITNYNPTLLTVDPNDGAVTISFTYAAVDAAGQVDPTPATVTMPFLLPPNLLLVKRITAVGGNSTKNPNDQTPLNQFVDLTDPSSPRKDDDNHPYWITSPTPYLLGALDAGKIKPGEEIEYTVYFLSVGGVSAKNVLFCDRIPAELTFVSNAFNTNPPAASGGTVGADRGIAINLGGTLEAYTNIADGDIARYFPPGSDPTTVYSTVNCGGANTNGAVVVNLGNLPNATASGTPTNSYGYVRFRATVK